MTMGDGYLSAPLIFLVQVAFGFYALAALLRFLLQAVRADFYNPVSQFIVRITTPPLRPLRRVIPPLGRQDLASLVLAWLVLALELLLVQLIGGRGLQPLAAAVLAVPELIGLTLDVFLYGILILVVVSWIAPGTPSPVVGVLHSLTEPVMRPARRLLPPIGGLDLSPMVAMVGLVVLRMLIMPPLMQMAALLVR